MVDPAFAGWLEENAVDLLINVHALHIIRSDVLSALSIGGFNLHPGPLPRYAGLNVPSLAVMNGETRHAVTLHRIEAGIDTGAIAYQAEFDLALDATGLSCSLQCVRLGVPLIGELLSAALKDPATGNKFGRKGELDVQSHGVMSDFGFVGIMECEVPQRLA